MSATGLEVFDKTLQATSIWLNEITRWLYRTGARAGDRRR